VGTALLREGERERWRDGEMERGGEGEKMLIPMIDKSN
jgi:hypothetical protein